MTRIRYIKTESGLQTEWLTVGQNLVLKGFIHPDNSYGILDLEGDIVISGQSKNSRQAKEKIRKSMLEAGLKVDNEIRRSYP